MKKKISLILICAMIIGVLALSGCGGSAEPSPLDGRWIGIGAEMFGIQIPVEEAFGGQFTIDILGMGKAVVTVGDADEKDKWELEGDTFTLHMRGADCVGRVEGDTIVFENMLDSGVAIIFAKEGTDAANAELYDNVDEVIGEAVDEALGESREDELQSFLNSITLRSSGAETNENLIDITDDIAIGHWECSTFALSAEDPGQDDPSVFELDNMAELMTLDITPDNRVHVTLLGEDMGSTIWVVEGGVLYIDMGSDIEFDIYCFDEESIEVDLYIDDTYTEFYCSKLY